MKTENDIKTCPECGQAFLSKYAYKTHSCKAVSGYTDRNAALEAIRAARKEQRS